ncbi:MAG: hypothetical protein QGI18_01290 [Candidatus Marinimicrobia bacterium]|nr:hypothetical protein [Candidatus Neomarinimicrobiota bacterium]|tara:strand:+ start:3875 stop:4168 length:294 start_codon:yes stop_codon:yes gene_type:complete
MLQLYNEKPIAIFMNNRRRIKIDFCNVRMELKMCQFFQFSNYLFMKSAKINQDTDQVNLHLVQKNLSIIISLKHFLQLLHGVQVVVSNIKGNVIISE